MRPLGTASRARADLIGNVDTQTSSPGAPTFFPGPDNKPKDSRSSRRFRCGRTRRREPEFLSRCRGLEAIEVAKNGQKLQPRQAWRAQRLLMKLRGLVALEYAGL